MTFLRELKQASQEDLDGDLESSSVHPRTIDQPHVASWETLGDDVTQSIKRAYPKKNRPSYNQVHVLLLNWEADDLGTYKEINDLQQIFEQRFLFNVQLWNIPSKGSSNKLEHEIVQFRESYDNPSNLLIVYYGGHGAKNKANRSIWVANQKADSPSLDWSDIQPSLFRAESDVLFLLDCCYAATAATRGIQSQKEILAACSVESETTGVSDNSFTHNLIDEMKMLSGAEFNVTTLHSRLMERRGLEKLRYTPIYASLAKDMRPSIVLTPFSPPPEYQNSDSKSLTRKDDSTSKLAYIEPATATFTRQLRNANTRVLICVRLKGLEEPPSAEKWMSYLVNGAPAEIEEMSIELDRDVPETSSSSPPIPPLPDHQSQSFVVSNKNKKSRTMRLMKPFRHLFLKTENSYDSNSTLLLVSVPIPIWDFLPDNPAYSFVGFIRSGGSKASPYLMRRWSAKFPVETNSIGPLLRQLTNYEHLLWWFRSPYLVCFVLASVWLLQILLMLGRNLSGKT